MKKLFLISALALLGFSSCKKDWECECTITIDATSLGGTKSTTTLTTLPINSETKSKAKDICEANGENTTYYQGTCRLK